MAKRAQDEDGQRPPKRPKSHHSTQAPTSPAQEIHSPRQLQDLLVFRQDALPQLREGIASFKAILDSILYEKEHEDRGKRLSILREFLESQKPADLKDVEHPFLEQLWQAWSFANAEYNDALSSAVAAIVALLLRTLSGLLEFRDLGFLLARTVLQHQHLRLVKKGLTAPRQKDFVISPCLRLLIEVVNFDGGVLARDLYRKRDETFEIGIVKRNLGILRAEDVSEEDAHRRPAIRTLAVRYVLAFVKYLHEGGKADILKNRPLISALFSNLPDDPPALVNELLLVTEQNLLKDGDLPRTSKAALLTVQNLHLVSKVAQRGDDHPSASKALSWLKAVIVTPSYGVLRPTGWYPPGAARGEQQSGIDQTIDLGLDSVSFYDRNAIPEVRNTVLLGLLRSLKPHSDETDRDLCLLCFRTAPELVAPFFAEMNVQLEPKLSNTWIGYASFLFESVLLPIPSFFGSESAWAPLPPQTNIMIENLLPRPLTHKVLTRCLNQNSDLITSFATRLLIIACRKLKDTLAMLAEGSRASNAHKALWCEASERLTSRFFERCPKMKDIIAAFHQTSNNDHHSLQREAISRLLALYYDVLPFEAMEEQFDVSGPLTAALVRTQLTVERDETSELRTIELEHLLQISRHSPGMRWFSKQGPLEFSPIVTLLQLHSRDVQNVQTRDLIQHVLKENDIIESPEHLSALMASVLKLQHMSDKDKAVWEFLDDCFIRVTRKPVKYLDDLEALASTTPDAEVLGEQRLLFAGVLLEQAPFVPNKNEHAKIMAWIESFVTCLVSASPDCQALASVFRHRLETITNWHAHDLALGEVEDTLAEVRLPAADSSVVGAVQAPTQNGIAHVPFVAPVPESNDHPELLKWARKELDAALEERDVEDLILCLCSRHADVRTQALVQLQKLEGLLSASSLDDKDHVYALVGELIETYEVHCAPDGKPLPYIAGTFATHALRVQLEATHFMYPKVNRYLNKGPEWRINKLPVYWHEATVLGQPEEDDAYWKEVQWTLDWLVDGLRTGADLEILRLGAIFEKVMNLYASPSAAAHRTVRERVLELLWRTTFIEGGSNTLITRAGALSWLQMVSNRSEADLEAGVRQEILKTCHNIRAEEWSGLEFSEM